MISDRRMELWGGVECTQNRVGDQYHEQLDRSGHSRRIDDLDRFAELGIAALRQPVLWERVAPGRVEDADWSWTDTWLERLQQLRIRPIVGLVHHGSGPRHTSLIDPEFPEKLAAFAGAVARRYPWVSDFTPVNEPLTTARFSALYGHWYPHERSDRSFLTAVINQCRAIVLAMRAIRVINPAARLVQTDDLGKVFSTPQLRYQADFENERRWICFDLLRGRVDRTHPLWKYLRDSGIAEGDILWFTENPSPPDVCGFNYYLTSERFLDHRVMLYSAAHGGNGKHEYVDIEAARVRASGLAGVKALLGEAWQRFRLPLAVTECHNGCTREEQLRWLLEIWRGAAQAQSEGVDVRAVAAWSLLGCFDWNSLVTRRADHYEPGVFDIRAPQPRATALARLLGRLSSGAQADEPLLQVPGWWRRGDRLSYGFAVQTSGRVVRSRGPELVTAHAAAPPILITGGRGTLGRAMARVCTIRGIPHRLLTREQMDIADAASVTRALDHFQPWAVMNAAGYVRVDEAEREAASCLRDNVDGPAVLAASCANRNVRLVTFSSDLVFDGSKRSAYVEGDAVSPLNVYGRSKAEAERRVLDVLPDALVIRTSAFLGPWDEYNFAVMALQTLAAGRPFRAAADCIVSPTYVPDLVNAALDLLIDGENGIWHLANAGEISWASLAEECARVARLDPSLIEACNVCDLRLPAPRPAYSALASERAAIMPPLSNALDRFVRECEISWADLSTIAA